jgi:hypothetical protein
MGPFNLSKPSRDEFRDTLPITVVDSPGRSPVAGHELMHSNATLAFTLEELSRRAPGRVPKVDLHPFDFRRTRFAIFYESTRSSSIGYILYRACEFSLGRPGKFTSDITGAGCKGLYFQSLEVKIFAHLRMPKALMLDPARGSLTSGLVRNPDFNPTGLLY